jgi:DNA-binding XRE family transcriptional regulator
MTTQLIRSEFASSPAAALTSPVPKFLVQVVNEGAGTSRILERPAAPEAASSEPCVLFHVTPVRPSSFKEGYDDFDRLASEVASDGQVAAEVVRGREWLSSTYGNGDLASLRLAAGLSQSELARVCDIEQPHVSRYESGRHEPLVSTAGKMAKALGVSLEVFLNAWSLRRAANDRGHQ